MATYHGHVPTCHCLYYNTVVNCGSPPSITNGSPGTPTSTTVGGTVTYSCDSGYNLSGSPAVSCLASGSWSTRPICTGNPESSVVDDV